MVVMLTTNATNLPRLIACNGSRLMVGSAPTMSNNEERDKGNAAHFLVALTFSKRGTTSEMVDKKAPNGVFITSEMCDHVDDYVNTILNNHQYDDDYSNIEVDTSFENEKVWRVNARADHIYYSKKADVLHVNDFKYGWRIVEPENNWTLIAHAIGYCIVHSIKPSKIVLTIHQPRPLHSEGRVRSTNFDYSQLLKYYDTINKTLSNPSDYLQTGTHCNKCPALSTCPAANNASMNSVDISELAYNENFSDGEIEYQLDTLRRAQAMLTDRLNACEEMAMHRIKSGSVIGSYHLQRQLTNRQWNSGINAELLQVLTGLDLTNKKLVTPSQAEKMGVDKEIVKALCERVETGIKLVRIDINKKANRIFGK